MPGHRRRTAKNFSGILRGCALRRSRRRAGTAGADAKRIIPARYPRAVGRTFSGGLGRSLRAEPLPHRGRRHLRGLLALFPGLAALVSLYGLVFDAGQIERQVAALSGVLPAQTQELLSQELHSLVQTSGGALGFAAIAGLLLALWSASRGMSGLITAINIAYEEKETRGFLRLNLIAIGLTLGLLAGGIVAIALVAVLPAAVQLLAVGAATKWLLLLVQWPLLIVLVMLGLAVLYRFGPDRDKPQWRWVSPGAGAATILWIVGSVAFTVYVANFNSYDKTYGSLGGVVILLTWLYLSALMVLLGAVVNAQSERQTRKDSTEGPPRAMGQRAARAADTLGESTG
jgi:membrane protein